MLDFQVVNNANTTNEVLERLQGRTREWYG
jgi:hypothetical protein